MTRTKDMDDKFYGSSLSLFVIKAIEKLGTATAKQIALEITKNLSISDEVFERLIVRILYKANYWAKTGWAIKSQIPSTRNTSINQYTFKNQMNEQD